MRAARPGSPASRSPAPPEPLQPNPAQPGPVQPGPAQPQPSQRHPPPLTVDHTRPVMPDGRSHGPVYSGFSRPGRPHSARPGHPRGTGRPHSHRPARTQPGTPSRPGPGTPSRPGPGDGLACPGPGPHRRRRPRRARGRHGAFRARRGLRGDRAPGRTSAGSARGPRRSRPGRWSISAAGAGPAAQEETPPLTVGWSSDVVFCTTLTGREITRFHGAFGLGLAGRDLVAEPGQQAPQPLVEQILRGGAGVAVRDADHRLLCHRRRAHGRALRSPSRTGRPQTYRGGRLRPRV